MSVVNKSYLVAFVLMVATIAFGQAHRKPASRVLQTEVRCDIYGAINNRPEDYSGSLGGAITTTDRNGTNVRTGPGKDFSISKTLQDTEGFWFHITGNKGAWVRVDLVYAIRGEMENFTDGKKIDGWVYAPSLFLKAAPKEKADEKKAVYNLYAQPDMTSRLLLTRRESQDMLIVSLHGCKDKWAKVSYKGKIGWLNPFTQCHDLWTESCIEDED